MKMWDQWLVRSQPGPQTKASWLQGRMISGFAWVGLFVSCLVFCSRGLVAQTGAAKTAGKVAPNKGISSAPKDSILERRGPREPAAPREGPPVEEDDPTGGGVSAFPGGFQPEQLVSPGGLSSTINLMVVLTVLSLAPSILIMKIGRAHV